MIVGIFLFTKNRVFIYMNTLIIICAVVVAMAALLLLISILTVIPFAIAFHIPTSHSVHKMSTKLQATTSSDTINTEQLLSTLIHAATHGAHTISTLADTARSGNIQFKEEGDARSALTIADTSAQRVIVSSILGAYPKLHIVGEEDESVEVGGTDYQYKLKSDLLMNYEWITRSDGKVDEPPPEELDMNLLTVFVDPLDGTREFVEGRLPNVQSLIGVTYKGTPLMGAVGLPFPTSNDNNSTEVLFGLVGKGIGKVCTKKNKDPLSEVNDIINYDVVPTMKQNKLSLSTSNLAKDDIRVSSGDSASVRSAVDLADKIFGGITHQKVGATGNKLLKIAEGTTTLSLLHTKTSLWDTAAPTAILNTIGGKVTDYFGEPLVYNTKELGNRLGVVASGPGSDHLHEDLVKNMRGNKKVLSILNGLDIENYSGLQCVDITRDLDGYLLTPDYFQQALGSSIEGATKSYYCPEDTAVRGLMSQACRVHLQPSGDTVFYKRIVFEHLDHARAKMKSAPHKLVRDVNSYKVEVSVEGIQSFQLNACIYISLILYASSTF